jgi:hypothetical protein
MPPGSPAVAPPLRLIDADEADTILTEREALDLAVERRADMRLAAQELYRHFAPWRVALRRVENSGRY